MLRIREAFVERVFTLVALEDGAKDAEILDLQGFLLLLHHVAKAFSESTPDHVEKLHSFSLAHLERIGLAVYSWASI